MVSKLKSNNQANNKTLNADNMIAAIPLDFNNFPPYQPPAFLTNGLVMTAITDTWYGTTWRKWGNHVFWLAHLPKLNWKEHIFTGAEGVLLWGIWCCPPAAIGALILNLGLTGQVKNAWYAHIFAHKAYARGFAVLIYDGRGHGHTAELSPVPPSYGWREGADQVQMATQLVALGCPDRAVLVGFSMGGQLALWGLRAATEQISKPSSALILGAATLSCHVESTLSLAHLRSTRIGCWIEQKFVNNLLIEVKKMQRLFPDVIQANISDLIRSIDSFDREIVINYYGFSSVKDYYKQTSCLYFLEQIQQPHLILYARNDPLFNPVLADALAQRAKQNSNTHLWLTNYGGHMAHINTSKSTEDHFWGFNRLLDFCDHVVNYKS